MFDDEGFEEVVVVVVDLVVVCGCWGISVWGEGEGKGWREGRGSTGCVAAWGCGRAVAEGVCEDVAG